MAILHLFPVKYITLRALGYLSNETGVSAKLSNAHIIVDMGVRCSRHNLQQKVWCEAGWNEGRANAVHPNVFFLEHKSRKSHKTNDLILELVVYELCWQEDKRTLYLAAAY